MNDNFVAIKEDVEHILALLDYQASVLVSQNKAAILIEIELQNPGLLIGQGGEGLFSLQHIARLVLDKKLAPEGTTIVLDVNHYHQRREELTQKSIKKCIERVKITGMEEVLPPMNSFERRLAHEFIATFSGITSTSVGEGKERRVIIKLAK